MVAAGRQPGGAERIGMDSREHPDRMTRRRERIRAEIERNRRGEYTIPTWVLVVALLAIVGGWIAVVALA